MSASAIIMLCVAISLIWGGLGVALVHIARHPEDNGAHPDTVENPVISG